MLHSWYFNAGTCLLGTTTALLSLTSLTWASGNPDRILQVGIVQRFGNKPTDTLTIQATPGDRLTLKFKTKDVSETLEASQLKLEISQKPLSQPQLQERVVLSTHRSFESAEYEANRWRDRGIPVEIAQPRNWEVWADRKTYDTPLLRRLLLNSLETAGTQTAYLETKVLTQVPKAAWVVNGFRYHRDELEILPGRSVVSVAGQRYAGSLKLQPNTYGTYTLVNQVPIEQYLRGVVPYEIFPNAPQTAVEAQAILARTYALRNLRRFAVDNYEMCADTQCQVYRGLDGATTKTDRAIALTRGEVLTYKGELVDALYSSATGGVTARFEDVWEGSGQPYLQSIIDAVSFNWDLTSRSLADEKNLRAFMGRRQGFNEEGIGRLRWRATSTMQTLNQELKAYLKQIRHPLANFQAIQSMQVLERAASGRIQRLAVTTDQGVIELRKDGILLAFDAPWSTLFYLEPIQPAGQSKPTGYAFVGGGFGHGVGLSQTGSYGLAARGWSRQQILSFYFPGTKLQVLNDSLVFWRDPTPKPNSLERSQVQLQPTTPQ